MRDSQHLLGRAPLWLGAAAILVASVSPALAAWEEDLAAQLRWDYDCRVAYCSGVIERLVEGQLVVIAKAHCEEGRTFDAVQRDELEDFEIHECTRPQNRRADVSPGDVHGLR